MRPIATRLIAAGYSPWIPVNRLQLAFGLALNVKFSSNKNLTCTVQYTLDDPNSTSVDAGFTSANKTQAFTMSRTTTSLSITKTNHGLSVGDWAQSWGNGGANLNDEWRAVASITTQDVFVVTVADSGLSAGNGVGWLQTARVNPHATLASLTADASGNLAFPVWGVRLYVSSFTAGYVDLEVLQGIGI